MTNNLTICTRIAIEIYNNNDQQFNRHDKGNLKGQTLISELLFYPPCLEKSDFYSATSGERYSAIMLFCLTVGKVKHLC